MYISFYYTTKRPVFLQDVKKMYIGDSTEFIRLSSAYTIAYEIVTYVTIVTNFNFFQKIFGIPSLHCLR